MEKFTVVKNDPNRSQMMAEVQDWIELNISNTDPRYLIVGNRVDHLGFTVTDLMFQSKNRWALSCPYVKDAVDRDFIWIEEVALPDLNSTILKQLLRQRSNELINRPPAFNPLEAGHGAREPVVWKTSITVFKTDHAFDGWYPLFDEAAKVLTPEFISRGLITAKFYPNNPERSQYNPQWRGAGASPAPLFVTRYLSEGDRHGLRSLPFYESYKRFFPEPAET